MVPDKNGPRKNGPRERWSPEKWPPGKTVPGKLRIVKSWGGRRASWCVWVECSDVINIWKPKTRQQKTGKQSLNRKQKIVGWALSDVVCVECSDVINLWKLKTRQPIFLHSFSVLQFGTYVGSWRKRRTFFCVCSGINW